MNLFAGAFLDRPAEELQPKDVEDWIGAERKGGQTVTHAIFGGKTRRRVRKAWSVSTVWRVKVAIKACWVWGAEQGHIRADTLAKLRLPRLAARTEIITPADFDKIVAACRNRELRDLLLFLRHTGCRPFEALQATAADIDWSIPAVRYHHARTKQKRKDRLICLTEVPLEIIKRRAAERPEGLLWRNRTGQEWDVRDTANAMRRLCNRVGVKATLYTLRHSYITDALLSGVSAAVVAELCGTSVLMIHRNYGHLEKSTCLPSLKPGPSGVR